MSNKKITKEDRALFHRSMGDVDKIESDRVVLASEKPKPRRIDHSFTKQLADPAHTSQEQPVMGERLSYSQPSTPHKTVNALRKGKIECEATLDLHGLTVKEAEQQLSKFMQQSLHHGLFSILIIHGKGFGSEQKYPALKNLVNNWLRRQGYVIAFCSAGYHDGGAGAVRVLINHHD